MMNFKIFVLDFFKILVSPLGWLSSVRCKYKPGYKPCDLLIINRSALIGEIKKQILYNICSPVWMLKFQPMREIEFITGHMVYNNWAYT